MSHIPSMRRRLAAQPAVMDASRLENGRSTKPRTPGLLGARGEIAVEEILASMPPDWAVFNTVPLGLSGPGADLLAVGPAGVFTINTAHLSATWVWAEKRTVMVSGRRMPYIREAESEAERVTLLLRERMPLRAAVRPVVALLGPRIIVVRGRPTQVKVVDARDLQEWLVTLPHLLRPNERMDLAAVIDNPVTWGARPSIVSDRETPRLVAVDPETPATRPPRGLWGPSAPRWKRS